MQEMNMVEVEEVAGGFALALAIGVGIIVAVYLYTREQ